MSEIMVVLLLATVVGAVGIGLGMLVLAPRLTRWTERDDEDPDA